MSQVCHIEAAEKGGQRYNHNSTDELRRQYDNLILLCPTHHKTTDDIDKYPVEVLKSMKSEHENKMEERKVSDKPTIFVTAINALVNIEFSNEDDNYYLKKIVACNLEMSIDFQILHIVA
jgi:hypothetical protein